MEGVGEVGLRWVDGPEDILIKSNLIYRLAYVQVAGWPD